MCCHSLLSAVLLELNVAEEHRCVDAPLELVTWFYPGIVRIVGLVGCIIFWGLRQDELIAFARRLREDNPGSSISQSAWVRTCFTLLPKWGPRWKQSSAWRDKNSPA
jgi:hypothetical protein